MKPNSRGLLFLPQLPEWFFWLWAILFIGVPCYLVFRGVEWGITYMVKNYKVVKVIEQKADK